MSYETNEASIRTGLEIIAEGVQPAMFATESLDDTDSREDSTFVKSCTKLHEKSRKWSLSRQTQGLGLAEKISDGRRTGELCVKVYVEKKMAKSKLANPVPKSISIPGGGSLLTDVEELGQITMESMTTRIRPVMPGCGLGHTAVNAGTLGCLVTKRTAPGKVYILSNLHILAPTGQATIGDKITQAAKYDGGKVTLDTVANLTEYEPLDFDSGYPNLIDAAIAQVDGNIEFVSKIRDLGFAPTGVSKSPKRDMKIQKVGRTSDLTIGIIRDIDFRTRFPYKLPDGSRKSVGFRDVVLCSNYTSPGDSGSAVLNMRKRIVGLHFAGSVSASIFCKIAHVFDVFELELP